MTADGDDERFANVAFLTGEAYPQSVAAMEQSDARPACLHWQELEGGPRRRVMTHPFSGLSDETSYVRTWRVAESGRHLRPLKEAEQTVKGGAEAKLEPP